MNKNISPILFIVLALVSILSLTACGASTPEPTPTIDEAPIQTEAVSTFAAGLTQTAFLQPTETPTSYLDAHPVLNPHARHPGCAIGRRGPYGLLLRPDLQTGCDHPG